MLACKRVYVVYPQVHVETKGRLPVFSTVTLHLILIYLVVYLEIEPFAEIRVDQSG